MYKIMTPGPTQVRKNVRMARSLECTNPDLDPAFYDYYKETCELISELLFTKNEALKCQNSEYIRVLGFNNKGKLYLNQHKKDSTLPIITGYSNINSEILNIEFRVNAIYFMIDKQKNKNNLITMEYKHKPIIK